jgi:hypothetical protein
MFRKLLHVWELNYELFSKFQLKVLYGNYANDHQSCEVFFRSNIMLVEVMEVERKNFG